jgi:hypothetical protein
LNIDGVTERKEMITFKRHGSSDLAPTVKPLDIGRHLRLWIVPAAATAGFSLLLLHRSSDSPVVFNRYSVEYATLLVLAALNLGLLWRKSLLRISYAVLVSYGIAIVSCTFLFDFFVMGVKLPFFVIGETGWIKALLLASFLLQLTGVQRLTKTSRNTAMFFAFRRVFTGKARDYELIDVGQSLQAPTALASGQIAAVPRSLPLNDVTQEQCLNSIGRPVGPGGKALCNVTLVVCSIVLVVIMAELVLRFFLLETLTPKNRREFLQLFSTTHSGNSIMSTQWPQLIPVTKPKGTFRILGLADSFGVVGGASANYHYLLEQTLRRQLSPGIQMVNVSVAGYEPRHELAILRFAMPYAPDLVLHGFFVGNDFTLYGEDNYLYRGILIENEPGVSRYWPRHFFLADLIHNQMLRMRELRQIELEQKTGVVTEAGYQSRKFFLKMQLQRMIFLKKQSENEMKRVFPILDSIRNVAAKEGARYAMIIHPDHTQVDESLRRDLIKTFQIREQDYDFDFPQKLLASYCAASGILCLDLLPALRAKAKQETLYTISDGHYNLAGNQLAADKIGQFIIDRDLVGSIRGTASESVPGL